MSPGDAIGSRLAGLWQRLRGSRPPRRLRLALQGGGSHGAFTWGVLDRLLEDERNPLQHKTTPRGSLDILERVRVESVFFLPAGR